MRNLSDVLKGVRVVELCWAWAGPLAARTLADFGAEVIKVEGPRRPDGVRFGLYAGGEEGADPWNRGGHYLKHGRNKRSFVVDLQQAAGRELFLALIAKSDVFVENNSPRVLPNLGLTYAELARVNPRLILLSMPGFGSTGPLRDWVGFGLNLEAYAGLSNVTGYEDTGPVRSVIPYGDPIAALHGVVAVLAALREARRSGHGRRIELAQNESLQALLAEPLFRATVGGEAVRPHGNHDPVHAPHNAYRCAGDDRWLTVAVVEDAQWPALCRAIGRGDLAAEAALRTAAGRKQAEARINAALAAWCATQDAGAAEEHLRAAGVPAGVAMHPDEVVADPTLRARDFWITMHHEGIGDFTYARLPWVAWRSTWTAPRSAPHYGADNDYVLRDLLGKGRAEIAALRAAAVVADKPDMA